MSVGSRVARGEKGKSKKGGGGYRLILPLLFRLSS
jgi:hypothetical protein